MKNYVLRHKLKVLTLSHLNFEISFKCTRQDRKEACFQNYEYSMFWRYPDRKLLPPGRSVTPSTHTSCMINI